MEYNLFRENNVIIENNKKYDILEASCATKDVIIYFTKKRIFNRFKRDYVSNYDLIEFLKFDIVIKEYFNNKATLNQVNKLLNNICKDYYIFSNINKELVNKEKLDDILNGYQIIFKLTENY